MSPVTAYIVRHTNHVISLVLLIHVLWMYVIDTPKSIYYCPLDRNSLHLWTDENCYWSSSYAEAREKFVALANALKAQVSAASNSLDLVDVKSISYDVSDDIFEKYGSYSDYLDTISESGMHQTQTIAAGKNTIDALLLTVRVPNDETTEYIDVIHSSGVHGVEGYLGSAVQIRFLHELILRNEGRIATNTKSAISDFKLHKLLLVHSVNPYGMRHHRRTNNNNVDLNRNALSIDEWKMIRSRDPNFAGYVSLDSLLNPFIPISDVGEVFSWVNAAKSSGYKGNMSQLKERDDEIQAALKELPDSIKECLTYNLDDTSIFNGWGKQSIEIIKSVPRSIKALMTVGYTQTKRALVSSQYLKQSGSQYGGGAHKHHVNDWENSIYAIQHAIKQFAGFMSADTANYVFWIDVHTGLGEYGEFALLSAGPTSSNEEPRWVHQLNDKLKKSFNTKEASNKEVSEGYELTRGLVNGQVLCPPPNCFTRTQEFGTRPGTFVGMAITLENKGYSVGNRDFAFITSWAFNPNRLSWRRKTLRGGIELLQTVFVLP